MSLRARLPSRAGIAAILAAMSAPLLHAQSPPGEVAGVQIGSSSLLTWQAVAAVDDYNVYRGLVDSLRGGAGARCHGDEIVGLSFSSLSQPPLGQAYYYLVTAEAASGGEGTPGDDTSGVRRILRGSCDAVMRHHLLGRTGFGPDEWSLARIDLLGTQGYLDEQLDPASIDESTNADLNARRSALVPPENLSELIALDVVGSVYSRRQLEHQVTLFWDNHFNTWYHKTWGFFNFYEDLYPVTRHVEAAKLHHTAQNLFRDIAFNGTFRELAEASALSGAMIIFLDGKTNVKTSPNENYARELLELYTMGVDGGYTQQDVVELARVFTGWHVCKKDAAVAGDYLGPCFSSSTWGTPSEPPGIWVGNYRTSQHDTGQKVLFQGTPHQTVVPSTASNPQSGVNDVFIALDAIVAHPSTPPFIARKMLQRFVTEAPTQAMVDAVVAEWNDATNPRGIGDMREVLRAVLSQGAFRDPDQAGGKIKTPFEHVASAIRAARGATDGSTVVIDTLTRMQELLHENSIPTGFAELGGDWIDTNNVLERQNFGLELTASAASSFGSDVIGLLNDNGVSTGPGNAAAIVDFFAGVLFGGALTPAERQRAIDYLTTDDLGAPAAYDDARIRETLGFMMGFAQFAEQ